MAELLWWHRVGQKVAWRGDPHPCWIVVAPELVAFAKGTVVSIAAVKIDACIWDFSLGDSDNPVWFKIDGIDRWFGHTNFQPLRETSIDCFRSLLSPTPEDHARFLVELASILEREAGAHV